MDTTRRGDGLPRPSRERRPRPEAAGLAPNIGTRPRIALRSESRCGIGMRDVRASACVLKRIKVQIALRAPARQQILNRGAVFWVDNGQMPLRFGSAFTQADVMRW